MMSLWDALRMNMMISYQELVRTFLSTKNQRYVIFPCPCAHYHGSLPQQPGLFGTDFRQQIPVGLPPSLHKLMLITCKTSRFASLCLRHTGDLSLMRDILTIEH